MGARKFEELKKIYLTLGEAEREELRRQAEEESHA
jgi:hypothetical protein